MIGGGVGTNIQSVPEFDVSVPCYIFPLPEGLNRKTHTIGEAH